MVEGTQQSTVTLSLNNACDETNRIEATNSSDALLGSSSSKVQLKLRHSQFICKLFFLAEETETVDSSVDRIGINKVYPESCT